MRENFVVGALRLAGAAIVAMLALPAAGAEGTRMRNLGEGLSIGTSVSAAQTTNDNFYYQETDPIEVEGLIINPGLSIQQTMSRSTAAFNVGAQIAEFDVIGEDSDFTDVQATASYRYDGGIRNFLSLEAGYQRGHDPFGIERTAGNPLQDRDMDEWNLARVKGQYRYGAPSAMLNLELEAAYGDKDYYTNEQFTSFMDHTKLVLNQALVFNYSPKTSALIEVGEDFIEFATEPQGNGIDRDAKEYRVRAGVRWKATAKTSGDLRVGVERRTLDDSRVEILDGVSWNARIKWEPAARTSVTLESSRSSQETVSASSTVLDHRRSSISFSQGWGKSFRTVLSATTANTDFVGATREDKSSNYALSAIYSFKGSLAVFADIVRLERDSNFNTIDFVATTALVGVRVSP